MSGNDPLAMIESKLGEVLLRAYDDAVSPGAQEVGKIVQSLLSIVRAPVQFGSERFVGFIEDAVRDVPTERRIPPHPALAGPIIENALLLPAEDPLREMFRKLLSRAMDSELVGDAHPAFGRIISHLAPDEAQLLYRLGKEGALEFKSALVREGWENRWDEMKEEPIGSRFRSLRDDMHADFMWRFQPFGWLDFPQNSPLYVEHLSTLGLVQSVPSFDNHKVLIHPTSRDIVAETSLNWIKWTTFGLRFHSACVPDEPDEEWGW